MIFGTKHAPPAFPKLSKAFNFKRPDLRKWIQDVIEQTPENDARKADLTMLWTHFFQPRFDKEQQMRRRPKENVDIGGPDPLEDSQLEMDPMPIKIHGVEIQLRSSHCALSALFGLILGRLPITNTPNGKCIVFGKENIPTSKYARCITVLMWKWSFLLAGEDAYKDRKATESTGTGGEDSEDYKSDNYNIFNNSKEKKKRKVGGTAMKDITVPTTFCVMWAESSQLKSSSGLVGPGGNECIFIYGTTKATITRYKKVWQISDAKVMTSGVGEVWSHDAARSNSHDLYRAPQSIKFTGIEDKLQEDSKGNRQKEFVFREYRKRLDDQEKVEEERSARDNKLKPRTNTKETAYWQYGDCAETWGITILPKILKRGAFATSMAIGLNVKHITNMTDGGDTIPDVPPVELKPACRNCTYMFSAMKWNLKITVADQDMLERYHGSWVHDQSSLDDEFDLSIETSYLDDSFSKGELVDSLRSMLVQRPLPQIGLEDRAVEARFNTRQEAINEFKIIWKLFQAHLSKERRDINSKSIERLNEGISYKLVIGINFKENGVWIQRHENSNPNKDKIGSMNTTIMLDTKPDIYVIKVEHFWRNPRITTRVPKGIFRNILEIIIERGNKA